MSETKERIFGYDLIKTVAIFMVVMYHIGGLDYGEIVPGEVYYPNLNKIISSLFSASVPLFLMVHGALIIPRQWDFKTTLRHAAKLIFLMVFWKIVLQYLIADGIFGIKHDMVHFWFLRSLAMVYVISYFMNRYKWIEIIVLSVLFVIPFLYNLFGDFLVYKYPAVPFRIPAHTGFFTLYTIFYFYMGFFLAKNRIPYTFSLFLLVAGILFVNFETIAWSNYAQEIFDGVSASFPTLGGAMIAIGCWGVMSDVKCSNSFIGKIGMCVGANTMGIYLFHVLILYILRLYLPNLLAQLSFCQLIFISVSVIILSLVCTKVINNCGLFVLLK